jgi:hypothetical protein
MKPLIFSGALSIAALSVLFTACKKNDPPVPVEEELITTLKLNVTATGFSKSFIYKVENGFGGSDSGTVVIDTIALTPNTTYNVEVEVLNEKENPAEDITSEILKENEAHLFLYNTNPATGAGAITFSNGSKDDKGAPFNQTINFTTGAAGSGSLTVHLMHLPSDKNGTTPAAAGGSTDLEAVFPVKLQ